MKWQIVEIGQCYTVVCSFIFCIVAFNQSIKEKHFCYAICSEAEKIQVRTLGCGGVREVRTHP